MGSILSSLKIQKNNRFRKELSLGGHAGASAMPYVSYYEDCIKEHEEVVKAEEGYDWCDKGFKI